MTFIFYDTETTGLDAGFDQILQFAAIVTDDKLFPIEEVNLRCRLQPHVVPSPGAFVITGVRPSDVAKANNSHYEMVREIRALIERHTPAVMVGFNSIGYDEGMLRQAFYQTLNPVYLTNTSGNSRMDILKVAHAASEYAPGVLEIPLSDKGRPSFKLALLAPANNLTHDDAHEAMSDTIVTLGLARLVRDRAPEVWEGMIQSRSKQSVLSYLDENEVFCFTDMMFKQPSIVATSIAANPNNSSEVVVFDLSHDPAPYLDLSELDLGKTLRASPRPFRIVKANQSPILAQYNPNNARTAQNHQELQYMREKAQMIRRHPAFANNIASATANRYPPRETSEYVEQRIFENFPSHTDRALMETFHARPWIERFDIVERFEDDRLRELGQRLIYVECPNVLTAEVCQRYDVWKQFRFHTDEDVPWLTIDGAYRELAALKHSDEGKQVSLLEDIETHLEQLSPLSAQ